MHSKDRALKSNSQHYHEHLFRNHDESDSQVSYERVDLGSKEITLPSHHLLTKNITHRSVILPAQTSISSTMLVSGGRIDFLIEKDNYYIRSMYLEVVVTNTSATTAQQLSPSQMILEEVKLIGNNKTEFINMTGLDLYTAACTFMSNAQIQSEAITTNLSTAWVANATIAAGVTKKYYIPLNDLLPKDSMFGWLMFNHRNLKMEVKFRGASAIEVNSSAGDGLPLRLDNVQLILETTHFPHNEVSALRNIHQLEKSFRYLYWNEQKFTQALAASTTYNFKLSSIKGLTPFFWIYLLPNAHTAQNSYRPSALNAWIERIELRDDNNSSISNSHQIDGDFIKNSQVARKLDTGHFVSGPSYFVSFGPDPMITYHENIHGGYEYIDDTNINITTKSTLASATYEIYFIVPTYALLTIKEDGQILYEK